MCINSIYRGDQINISTKAEVYRSNGLFAKQINNGISKHIERNELLEFIRCHVKPESISEYDFRNKSCFISFSSSKSIAAFYAAYDFDTKESHPEDLIMCNEYFEKRYIFHMDISNKLPITTKRGLFKFEYKCFQNTKIPDAPSDKILFDFFSEKDNARCDICQINNGKHLIYLIDVPTFIKSEIKSCSTKKYQKAIDSAENDKEWLVMPADFLVNLGGNSSRIPRSIFWSSEHYYLRSEGIRNPEDFKLGHYNLK
jgi:hypothetical protein